MKQKKIAVIGLGYVGFPLVRALAKCFSVVGFDIDNDLIKKLNQHPKGKKFDVLFTNDPSDMSDCSFYIVCVPTPINKDKTPDLRPLRFACYGISKYINFDSIVVFESTVYPGLVNSFCKESLPDGISLGYSPERINPGDEEHNIHKVTKVISANDKGTLDAMDAVYGTICKTYRAPSIEVAEAAKVIENTQRDINIALMNELAMIFDKMEIDTKEVLKAASTKWNFHNYKPGLVGGHCIPVDPYYLASRAETLGYKPKMILAGREVNDSMAKFIADKAIKLAMKNGLHIPNIAIVGLTFKENVIDERNSMAIMIEDEIAQYGLCPITVDPLIHLHDLQISLQHNDVTILAVPHDCIMKKIYDVLKIHQNKRVVIDVKGVLDQTKLGSHIIYWSL